MLQFDCFFMADLLLHQQPFSNRLLFLLFIEFVFILETIISEVNH